MSSKYCLEISLLTDSILSQCKRHNMHVETATEGNFRLFTDQATGITIFFKINDIKNFSYYFLQRTNDYVFSGDRSDNHVILSLMFSCFLRNFETNISSSLYDIRHPIIEDEIWGRNIIPEQNPNLQQIKSWKDLEKFLCQIIEAVAYWRDLFWKYAGCPCKECVTEGGFDSSNRDYQIASELDHSKNKNLKYTNQVNYGSRNVPNWHYSYDIKNEVTIIKSHGIADYVTLLLKNRKEKVNILKEANGEFIKSSGLKHFIPKSTISEFNRHFKALGKSILNEKNAIIPLENMIVSVSSPYVVALGKLVGHFRYFEEREKIKKRHNKESEFLFPIPVFEWCVTICADQFENLIKRLLERESMVSTVRKNSPVNQGDKGRDLLIEWDIIDSHSRSEKDSAIHTIKVVGQCKVSKSTVGKSKVVDIRDTIDCHNASGYFLAVSSQISAPLTEILEGLKSKGIWTEWWNRDDIEIRLSQNQDLILLFPEVLKVKNGVKFYEKDY